MSHRDFFPASSGTERVFADAGPWPRPHALHRDATGGVRGAQVVFDACWRKLEGERGERSSPLQAPAEVVWLNGAPGSGKGANTPFIMESRGITRAITMLALHPPSSPPFNILQACLLGRMPRG